MAVQEEHPEETAEVLLERARDRIRGERAGLPAPGQVQHPQEQARAQALARAEMFVEEALATLRAAPARN